MEGGDSEKQKQLAVGDAVEDLMEAVNLGGSTPPRPAVPVAAAPAAEASAARTDATAGDDDDVNALLNELDEESQRVETSAETQQALQKLKDSTNRLGSALTSVTRDLDTKLGLTSSLNTLDEQMHATATIQESSQALGQSLSSTFSGFWTSVDSVVTKPLQQTLESTVETELPIAPGETKTLGDALTDGTSQLNETFLQIGRSLKQVDESHKITAATATTLALGADFLTESVFGAPAATPLENLEDLLTQEEAAAGDGEKQTATTTAAPPATVASSASNAAVDEEKPKV